MANSIFVNVRNYEKYKGRKDVEHNSWFRCENTILEDPDFFDFSPEEILVWIYILSLSSKKNSPIVEVKFLHAERVCRLRKRSVENAINKLMGNQILPVDVTSTLRPRTVDVTSTCATDRQTDKQTVSTEPQADALRSVEQDLPHFFLTKDIKPEIQELWQKTYQDEEWIKSELSKAAIWVKVNPTRAPKRNFARFLSGWLSRGWERRRKESNGRAAAQRSYSPMDQQCGVVPD